MNDIARVNSRSRPLRPLMLIALLFPVIALVAGSGCGPDQGEYDRLAASVTRLEQEQEALTDRVAVLEEQHREMAAGHDVAMQAHQVPTAPMGAMPMGAPSTGAPPTAGSSTGAPPMGAMPMDDDPPMPPSSGMGHM